jgi:hypothetical protein
MLLKLGASELGAWRGGSSEGVTAIDCGAPSCPTLCPDGEGCGVPEDCISGVCWGGECPNRGSRGIGYRFGCQYGDSLAGSVGGGTGPRPSHEQGDAAGDVPAGTKSIAPPRHPAARH